MAELRQHDIRTLTTWAEAAGFTPQNYARLNSLNSNTLDVSPMDDAGYSEMLVQLLVAPVAQRRYDEHGQLYATDEASLTYQKAHAQRGCP